MPLVEVAIVLGRQESLRETLAGELADRIGVALNSPPGNTWVTVRAIPAGQYAENQGAPSADGGPVFVSILKAKLPDSLQPEVSVLTSVVAQVCGRVEDQVHIRYEPAGAGRIAFGGRCVDDSQ